MVKEGVQAETSSRCSGMLLDSYRDRCKCCSSSIPGETIC